MLPLFIPALASHFSGVALAEPVPLPDLQWRVVNDTVMGGVSEGRLVSIDGGTRFTGELSLESNGGFVSIRSDPRTLPLDDVRALRVTVKGDGRTWNLTARRSDVPLRAGSYRADFATLDGEPVTVTLPLADFEARSFGRPVPDAPALQAAPDRITSVGFLLADGNPGPFQLDVLSVEALTQAEDSAAPTLEEARWTHRLIAVVAADPDDPRVKAVRDAFRARADEVSDRKLRLVTVLGDPEDGMQVAGVDAPANALVDAWSITPGTAFQAVLVGLDGGVKAKTPDAVDLDAWFARIDAMPMRMEELRRRR